MHKGVVYSIPCVDCMPKCIHCPDCIVSEATCEWTPLCAEEWGHPRVYPGRTHVQDWSYSGPQPIRGDIKHQHPTTCCMLQELVHSAQPVSLGQGASNPGSELVTLPEMYTTLLDWLTVSYTNTTPLHAKILLLLFMIGRIIPLQNQCIGSVKYWYALSHLFCNYIYSHSVIDTSFHHWSLHHLLSLCLTKTKCFC